MLFQGVAGNSRFFSVYVRIAVDNFQKELFFFKVKVHALLFHESDHFGAGEGHFKRKKGGDGGIHCVDQSVWGEGGVVDLELCKFKVGHFVRVGFVWVGY